ncbi:MAG: Hsp20/alpha crystallin family protein [Moorella humiferrea]|nr:Hsp20/alpha crystallin family protein [Moorella humiferrea]
MLQPQGQWFVPGMTSPGWMAAPADVLVPPVDVLESDHDLIYIFAVPGARPEDVRVEVRQQALEIEGTVAAPDAGRYVYRYQEWPVGRFYRLLPLPPELDGEKAAASFDRGLLMVRFPKTNRGRQIAVNVQSPEQNPSPGQGHLI